jgi:hypothetical protein
MLVCYRMKEESKAGQVDGAMYGSANKTADSDLLHELGKCLEELAVVVL